MDYTTEPPYSTQLNVQGTKPLNAEPSAAALVEFNITPEELLYCRNHGPVRVFDEEAYSLTVKGTSKGDINLSLAHLKSHYRLHHVTATLQVRTRPEMFRFLSNFCPSVLGSAAEKWAQLNPCMVSRGPTALLPIASGEVYDYPICSPTSIFQSKTTHTFALNRMQHRVRMTPVMALPFR